MFLRATTRKKDGKEHRYWSIVENKRLGDGRVMQRHVLYLGEINALQELAWRQSIEVFEDGAKAPQTLALFREDRCEGLVPDGAVVRLRLSELRLCRPRQWGGCWLALELWQALRLDEFWAKRHLPSRKGTSWDQVLFVLVAYRLFILYLITAGLLPVRLAPGSEWRLHREWFDRSALALVRAALTRIQGYRNQGKPIAPDRTASYEDWSDSVRQAVLWAGRSGFLDVADPCDAIDTSYEEDPETRKLAGLLECWHTLYGEKPKTVAEIIAEATTPRYGGVPSTDRSAGRVGLEGLVGVLLLTRAKWRVAFL